MTAEVPNVLTQLATIQREIIDPSTSRAIVSYENVPYTISAADMPLFVNFVGPLTQAILAGSDEDAREFNEIRTFNMMFFHSPYGAGVEGEKMGLLTPYFPLIYAKFAQYPHLKQLAGTLDSKLTGDTGMTVLSFGGQQYYGVRFALQVTSKNRRLLGEFE
jgi:hypothetical protein